MPLNKIISESIDLTDTFNFTGTLQQNGAGIGGANTPMFYSYMSGNQSIGTGAITKIQFSQEEYDIGSTFDTTNYRYTPGFTGKSFLIGSGRWNSGSDWNNNFLYIYKNGSQIFTAKEVHTHYDIMRIGVVVDHDSNDYFELYIEQQSGGTVDLYGGSGNKNETYFQGFKLIT